ncbi:DUF6207 family protein [Streptomyces sp. NPDC088762]|uniref:DUF6207 family protein n=1 Tax=Streptomyces sp. NPDC088762 TaxID=3365891 RepID=UPI003807240F
MKPIDEQHIAEPSLVVLDIIGGDEDTVRAFMAAMEERWGEATPEVVDKRLPFGSTPTSCAQDGAAREWSLGKPFVKGLPRVS